MLTLLSREMHSVVWLREGRGLMDISRHAVVARTVQLNVVHCEELSISKMQMINANLVFMTS
jgi:hypothetical protein